MFVEFKNDIFAPQRVTKNIFFCHKVNGGHFFNTFFCNNITTLAFAMPLVLYPKSCFWVENSLGSTLFAYKLKALLL